MPGLLQYLERRISTPGVNVGLFLKGVTFLSRLTGKEYTDLCRIPLGLIVDMDLPACPIRLVWSTRAPLDCHCPAQYLVHTTETLKLLRRSLQSFPENKKIFVELGIRENLNLPKLHSSIYYVNSIELFSTTDTYNTKYTECLHIDLAKDTLHTTPTKNMRK